MKRLITALTLALFFSALAQGRNSFGVFGTSTDPDDTCSLYFTTFDTLGHSADPVDSIYILRFVRGTLVDSINSWDSSPAVEKVRNYYWGVRKKAYDGSNLGQYSVVCYWKPVSGYGNGKWYNNEAYYSVEQENEIGPYWGACDGCYQRYFPEDGSPNKDSAYIIDPSLGPDSLLAKLEYRHSNTAWVTDSTYFYLRPWW